MGDVVNKTERLKELDILRAFAILAVILIHTLGVGFTFVSKWSLSWDIYVVLDQFMRFAVPVFVFISGYTLALKYNIETFNFREFYIKRVLRILPWYFFWSAVIFFYTHYIRVESKFIYPLWKIILLGKADYHLYFVSMIFQLYILFPLILYLIFKLNRKFVVLVFFFQVFLYIISSFAALGTFSLGFVWGDQQQYVFFGTWIFYFVLGIVFAQKSYTETQIKKLKTFSIYFALLGFILSVADCIRVVSATGDLIIAARSSRVTVMLYAIGWLSSAFIWAKELLKLPNILKISLIYISERSFLIYLLHTLVIRIISLILLPSGYINLLLFTFLVFIFSVILAEISAFSARFCMTIVFKK